VDRTNMHQINYREHEMGTKPRMRIWTEQQAGYGQFEIISNQEFETLKRILSNMGYEFIEHRD
jgi:hypothetical protein